MNKEIKNKIVPKLRFPEFVNEGEWEDKKLGGIGEPLMCKRIFKEQTTSDTKNGIPFYKIGTFGREADSYISEELYNDFKSRYSFPKIGDILISASGTIGRLVIYDGSPAYFQDSNIIWLGNNEEKVLNSFLFYCYSTLKWQTSDGGVISRLYNSDLKNMTILFPRGKKEQQKIADCLSSLDDIITAQNQKLEALKDHKKGLMQQLFPAEGETVPMLRFAEFKDNTEWVLTPLKDVFSIFQGFAFSSNDSVREGVRWLKIADVSIQQMDHDTPSFLPLEFKEKYKNFLVEKGDYVIALTRPILSKELKMAQVDEVYHESLLNQRVGKLVTNKNIGFVYYLLQTSKLILSIEQNIAGSEPPNLSAQQIEDIEVYIPRTNEEQQKVAECLSSLDKLITAQTEKIESLQKHKKGLMQGLFPTVAK